MKLLRNGQTESNSFTFYVPLQIKLVFPPVTAFFSLVPSANHVPAGSPRPIYIPVFGRGARPFPSQFPPPHRWSPFCSSHMAGGHAVAAHAATASTERPSDGEEDVVVSEPLKARERGAGDLLSFGGYRSRGTSVGGCKEVPPPPLLVREFHRDCGRVDSGYFKVCSLGPRRPLLAVTCAPPSRAARRGSPVKRRR